MNYVEKVTVQALFQRQLMSKRGAAETSIDKFGCNAKRRLSLQYKLGARIFSGAAPDKHPVMLQTNIKANANRQS